MRASVQRVSQASVTVEGEAVGAIQQGLVVLLGVTHQDTATDVRQMAEKIVNLRIFADDQGKMNRSVADVGGQVLIISQFTLLGDCRKGRRPSFPRAAPPELAEPLYQAFVTALEQRGLRVARGIFGAMMEVELVNDGPVTILLEARDPR